MRILAIPHLVACLLCLSLPLLFGLTIIDSQTTAGELVLASYRHTASGKGSGEKGTQSPTSYLLSAMQNGASKMLGEGSVGNRPPSTEADSDEANQFPSEDEDHGDHETLCRNGKRKRPVSVS